MSTIKRLLALAPFLLIGITVMAQGAGSQSGMENGSNATAFAQRLYGHIGFGASTKHDGMTPAEFSADLGYRFIPRMYAFFHAGGLYGLYDKWHGQAYTKSTAIGGGLGYTLFKTDGGGLSMDVRGTVAAGVGNADWKHTSYDAALMFRIGRGIKMDVSIGYKHVTSHTAGIGSYNGLACTLGFGF